MLGWIREKFGTVLIGLIIGFIAFVFVFYGVFSPKATRGLHEGSVAGTVNGDPISIAEFNRELNRRMEFFKNMGGGRFTEEQLKAFHVRESVFQEMVRRKLMVQEAEKRGMVPGDEEVRDRIRDIPAFQKNGAFDFATYKQVLEANNLTPGGFERMMREDLSAQQWEEYFRNRVHVSDTEVKNEFLVSQDKRKVRYVLLTNDAGRKGVQVEAAEVAKFLADPARQNLAKSQYEGKKTTEYKGKTFDQVKEAIARDVLAGEKTAEIQKVNEKLAGEVLESMTTSSASDKKVDTILKPYGVQVKTSDWVSRQNPYIPGIGKADDLMKDLFAEKSPIDPTQGGKPKKYTSAGWVLIAVVSERESPDLSKVDTKRDDLIRQLSFRKEKELFSEWIKKIGAKAKVDPNPSVVGDSG